MTNRLARARRAFVTVAALSLGLALTGSGSAFARNLTVDAVPDQEITMDVVAINGSGCPAGTAAVRPSGDRTSFTVAYQDFTAAAGPNTDPPDIRQNCQLGVLVHVPQGWTFALARAEHTGSARLASGATGMLRSTYYWQGSPTNTLADHKFSGPNYDRWTVSDSAPVLSYAPCSTSRVLNVNTELRVNAGSGSKSTSSLTLSASSGSVSTLFQLSWERC